MPQPHASPAASRVVGCNIAIRMAWSMSSASMRKALPIRAGPGAKGSLATSTVSPTRRRLWLSRSMPASRMT